MAKTIRTEAVDDFFEAIMALKTKEEFYNFFEDICTTNEVLSIAERLEVAKLLYQNKTYVEIAKQTGASTATISRVNRSMNYGNESYDFIFLDSAKGQYITFLPELIRVLTPGGMLVSDNCLQDGDVIESRYAVRRRDRTIHDRMRMYLSEVASNPSLTSAILPMADGVTVSYKAGGSNEQ